MKGERHVIIESKRIAHMAILIILFAPSILFSQGKVNQSKAASQMQFEKLEVLKGKYVFVSPESLTYSPAYRFSAPGFFMSQVNVSPSGQNIVGDAANEPSIAVDPTNPSRMAIGWRQFNTVTSDFRQAGYAYTTDGGQTWAFPGVIEPGIFRSDPVLDSDVDGNFYYNSLSHDPFNNFICDVFRSSDGGATWGSKTPAQGGDKQWMIIDKTESIGNRNVYSYWTSYYSICPPGFFTRGPFGGLYYENCVAIPGNPFWGTLAVNKEGDLYVCGANFVVAKSSTARDINVPVTWDTAVAVNLDGYITSGADPNPGGIAGQTWIAVDQTMDYVYVLCSVQRISNTDPLDVMFSRSTDGGLTWSPPRRVNDDTSSTAWQWFGTMSVAPNGRIDVVWLDTRDNPGTVLSSLYYSYSINGGSTWSPNERLSPSFDPHLGWPQQSKMGDYFHMVSDDSGAHLAWAGTFNGEQDVYYGRISNTAGVNAASFAVNRHWNLVSVPLIVPDYRKMSLFPTAASGAFRFRDGIYEQQDTLTSNDGYWLRFGTAQTLSISGLPTASAAFAVHPGWNLIGSLGSPIPTAIITSDPPGLVTSRFFGYDERYFAVDTLQPGKGHWVKVGQEGTLELSVAGVAHSGATICVIPTDELPPPAPAEFSGDESKPSKIPADFSLGQNYPNPFNPITTISFALKNDALVTLKVYNTLGTEVAELMQSELMDAGDQQVRFDATAFPSGVYYYKIIAQAIDGSSILFSDTRKMLLVK